jgi:hypothetical protein
MMKFTCRIQTVIQSGVDRSFPLILFGILADLDVFIGATEFQENKEAEIFGTLDSFAWVVNGA